ncbi:MAG: hypothetical protein ACOYJB_07130 [Christensenellaceae bacterium]|jgi:hypothetical protein
MKTLAIIFTALSLIISMYSGSIIWGLWITTGLCFYLPLLLIHLVRKKKEKKLLAQIAAMLHQ